MNNFLKSSGLNYCTSMGLHVAHDIHLGCSARLLCGVWCFLRYESYHGSWDGTSLGKPPRIFHVNLSKALTSKELSRDLSKALTSQAPAFSSETVFHSATSCMLRPLLSIFYRSTNEITYFSSESRFHAGTMSLVISSRLLTD